MATRMQQRRGTEAQWTSANPVLAAGEIGFEIDTNKFKIGDGINLWDDLAYFLDTADLDGSFDDYVPLTQRGANNGVATLDSAGKIPVAQLGNLVDGADAALNTLNELAAALDNDASFATTVTNALANKAKIVSKTAAEWASDTSQTPAGQISVESDTGKIKITTVAGATFAQTDYVVSEDETATLTTAVDALETSVTNLQGVVETVQTDFNTLEGQVTTLETSMTDVTNDITDINNSIAVIPGIESDISDLESAVTNKAPTDAPTFTGTVVLPSTTSIGDVSSAELGYVNGVTSGIQSQLDDKLASSTASTTYAPLNAPTFTGTVVLPSTTSIGNVDATELAYVNGVTSAIQTQLDAKAPTASPTFTGTVSGVTKAHVGLGNVDNTSDAAKPVSTATQTALNAKASLAGAVFTGNVEVDGNLVVDGDFTVNGTNFNASATTITIEDSLVQLAHQNPANTVDLGLVVAYNDGAAKHAGIVRDVSDNTWKLFQGVTTEPTTTVNFAQGSLDNLALNNVTVAGVVFTDGTQTKQGVPSITTISQKAASYTLSNLDERDTIVEISNASATTLTIPTDATVNYPVGTTIDVLQTNTGQVTIAGAGGVTVNSTPGLKLRTRWSSATLLKRAANTWVVYGDLTA